MLVYKSVSAGTRISKECSNCSNASTTGSNVFAF